MKTKILLFLLCVSSLSVMGQGVVIRDKCKTCGQAISQCQYKGKHPTKPQPEKTCSTCGKALSKCLYKGKHPMERTCTTCGNVLSKCQYNGNHPAPEAAGYDVTFSCNVPSASLYIDGKANDTASGTRFLKTGNHSIRVTASGYEDYSNNITVNRQNTSFSITLNKKPEPVKPVVTTSGTLNGHEWVDLGLSVKWATCNVGASSPSDYGGYYAWGETRTKSSYDWDNCFDCVNPKKWDKDSGWGTYKLGGQTRITPSSGHDTARENWGGTWRMPTDAENDELCKKCKWTWTSQGGHNGYKVTGPNGNSIFLPAAGWRLDTGTYSVGEYSYYWSSTLSSLYSYYARCLYFNSSSHSTGFNFRSNGKSVRPVTE